MNLIYIGKDFYWESGTMMSSLYDESGKRMDWGFVGIALERGEEVHIRQATPEEKEPFYKRFFELKKNS
jgi:hypothetical protein